MNAWMTWSWNMWYVTIALCSNFFLDRQLVRSDRRSRCNSPWAQCTTNCHSIFVYDILLVFACTCSGHKGLTGVSLHPYWLIKAPSQAAWTFGRRNHSLIPILLRHRFHKGKCLKLNPSSYMVRASVSDLGLQAYQNAFFPSGAWWNLLQFSTLSDW